MNNKISSFLLFIKRLQDHNQLQQKMAVITDQLQRAQNDLGQANDKIEALRQEKQFLVQEKSQIDGTLKQLQRVSAA
jgi:predicted  nucleic acid-binding Zn-ribbon protein